MNIEELKLVLEAINQFTSQATTAGIWWAVLHYVLPAITKITGFIVAGVVAVKITKYVASTNEWAAAGRRVSKAYGGSGYSMMGHNDEQAINNAVTLAIVRKAAEKSEKQ